MLRARSIDRSYDSISTRVVNQSDAILSVASNIAFGPVKYSNTSRVFLFPVDLPLYCNVKRHLLLDEEGGF